MQIATQTYRVFIVFACIGAACSEGPTDLSGPSIVFAEQPIEGPLANTFAMGDVNGDGTIDILSIRRLPIPDTFETFQPSLVFFGEAGAYATTSTTPIEILEQSPDWALLEDLDGDGDLDALIDDQQRPVWFNDGAGNFSVSDQTMVTRNGSFGAAMGDLDGDGDIDMFDAVGGAGLIRLNDGTGRFTSAGQTPHGTHQVALGDIDGDGDLDAFGVSLGGSDRIWLNDGAANFVDSGQRFGTGILGGSSVALGDLDNDGDLDAVVGSTNYTKVWFNDGTGKMTDSGQRPNWRGRRFENLRSRATLLADFDADGDLDVAFANFTNQHQIWENDGSGLLTKAVEFTGDYSTSGVLADTDGDGDLDFITSHGNAPLMIWLNQSR